MQGKIFFLVNWAFKFNRETRENFMLTNNKLGKICIDSIYIFGNRNETLPNFLKFMFYFLSFLSFVYAILSEITESTKNAAITFLILARRFSTLNLQLFFLIKSTTWLNIFFINMHLFPGDVSLLFFFLLPKPPSLVVLLSFWNLHFCFFLIWFYASSILLIMKLLMKAQSTIFFEEVKEISMSANVLLNTVPNNYRTYQTVIARPGWTT